MTFLAALRTGFVLALAFGATSAVCSTGVTGTWLVENEEARVEIAPCGEKLCGTIVWMRYPQTEDGVVKRDIHNPDRSLRERTVVGLRILTGLPGNPDDEGVYRGGSIYDPKTGRTYRCWMSQESDDVLRIRGFFGISLLGRTTRWTRVAPNVVPKSGSPPTTAE
jgi:uncharacterized protein (DUF2147 family)